MFTWDPKAAAISAVVNLVMTSMAKIKECTCNVCPGLSQAVGKFLGGSLTALLKGIHSNDDLAKVEEDVRKVMLEGICPMVGAFDCMQGIDKCDIVTQELKLSVAKDWLDEYLEATEKKSTQEMCRAAGVETSLMQFTSGSASNVFMASFFVAALFAAF